MATKPGLESLTYRNARTNAQDVFGVLNRLRWAEERQRRRNAASATEAMNVVKNLQADAEENEKRRQEYAAFMEATRATETPAGPNALTPEMEARYQQANGVNRAPTAYQTYMMRVANSMPQQEETRSTDELRRDMNRQNRIARGTERMTVDMAGQGLRDQSLLFNPTYTSNLRTMGQTMEAQQNKAAAATNLYQTLSVQRREQEEREKYSALMQNPDFAAKSQGDPAIGRKVSATSLSPAERLYQNIYNHGGEKTNAKDRNAAEFVSDEEAGIFFYLWNTQGPRAAQSYYNDYVDNRASQRRAEEAQRQAEAFGHYDVIGSSAESVVANFASGVGLVGMAWQNIARSIGLTDRNKPLNYYSSAQLPGLVSDAIRKGAADELAEMFPKLKIGKGENAVNVASFLYETGMSMADSGVAALLNTIGIPEAATLANMGAAAGTRAIRDARERGATDGQALAFGISSAIMEALFEKISLDRILEPSYAQTAKAHFLNALKQSFTEGSEEVMTTLANTAMDQLIMGDKSELFTRQRQLMEQGVSEKEALGAAFKQLGTEIVGDLLGGMISGFGMGGAKEVGTGIGVFAQGVRQDMQTARALTDYQNTQQTAPQVQQAAPQITPQQTPAAPVQQRQLTEREQNPLQFALNKAQNGETVTGNDAKAILNDPQAVQTLRDAGVLADTIRPGAEGRAQIQRAVQALAERNTQTARENVRLNQETAQNAAPTENESQQEVQFVQETTQERTAPPLPRQTAQEQQERVTTPPVPQNTQETAQEPTLRLRAQEEEQAPRQEALRIRDSEVAEPTRQAPLTIRGANATVEENRQEESYGQGQQTETAAAAGEDDFRSRAETAAEGARRSYLDRIERSSGLGRVLQDLRNYRVVRGAESRASEVSRIRNQAEAGNQRDVSALDYGISNGSAEQSAKELDNATASRVLGRNWDRAVAELARQGVTLKAMTGQLKKEDGTQVRAFFSGDGKTIIVQADHPKLSWNQLLDHEDLHRRIKENPAYRKAVEDALLADKKLQAYLPEIIDRYAQAYARLAPGLSSDDVIEELLADYRAGFDMLDPLGMNPITARAAKRAAKDIKSAEKTLRKQYETNGGKPAPADIEENFAEAKNSVEPPYRLGTKAAQAFEDGLNEQARSVYDMFLNVRNASLENTAVMTVGAGKKAHPKRVTIADRFLTAADWNDQVKNDPEFAQAAKNIFSVIPADIRKNARLNDDGTISETEFEKRFKMARSLVQRLVDALPKGVVGSTVVLDGKSIQVARGRVTASVGGEEYRRALIAEKRRLYEEGSLPTRAIGTLSHDNWGAMGFLATNTKTIASGDFTTFCPQMYFNDGCWYCYRRAALTSGVNNKLTAETVWYAGEILQLRQADIDRLNQVGGLRIQSFGDWMTQYSTMLADMLIDAEKVGLQIKIITKEPSMIDTVALLKEQGLGKSLYFNLSADYTIEKRGKVDNTNTSDALPMNPERPFMQRESESGEEETWWKRALTVQEANEYRKMYPWVNTRIVATNLDEFIRGLSDPTVDVVTGYHGDIRQQERVSSETGETLLDVEPLGDAGMPRFAYDRKTGEWTLEYEGKSRYQKQLAQRIQEEGLEREYYTKSCCIFGRCAKCQGKCGSYARSFAVKNATNRDQESVKYWQREMESGVDNPLLESQQEDKASTEIDTDYLAAINSGDMETAQRMVDEAAKKAGYTVKKYHQTDVPNIHVFDIGIGTHGGTDSETPYGIFTKNTRSDIGLGDIQMSLYLKPGKTFVIKDRSELRSRMPEAYNLLATKLEEVDAKYNALVEEAEDALFDAQDAYEEKHPEAEVTLDDIVNNRTYDDPACQRANEHWKAVMAEWSKEADKIRVQAKEVLSKYLRDSGYDSMEIKLDKGTNGRSTDTFIVFSPEQVKSADPVTYDDNGKVIPLSQRFNTKNEDIRYSTEISEEDLDEAVYEEMSASMRDIMRRLQDDVDRAKEPEQKPEPKKKAQRASDEEYMAALEDGDIAKAQRLVRETADAAMPKSKVRSASTGELRYVYHYTNKNFYEFRPMDQSAGSNRTLGDGYYVSTSETEFKNFGKNKMTLFANITKPFEMSLTKKQAQTIYDKYFRPLHPNDIGKTYEDHVLSKLQTESRVFDYLKEAAEKNGTTTSKILTDLGFDGVHDGVEWVAFKPEQLKSADVGTYNDDGQMIPLSERFNPKEKDTRYSIEIDPEVAAQFSPEGVDQRQVKSLIRENEQLKKDLKRWKAQVKTSDRTQPREEDVRRMANDLLKSYKSNADKTKTIDSLRELAHTAMSNDTSWTDVHDQAVRLAGEIIDYAFPSDGGEEDFTYSAYLAEATEILANDIIDRVIGEEIRQAPTTYADRAEERIAKATLKGELRVQKVMERLEAERERRREQVAEVKEHYKSKEAKGRENRAARELRTKIIKHAKNMTTELLKPTDKKHVPESLRKSVAAVLSAIDLGSGYDTTTGQDGKTLRVGRGTEGAEQTKRTKAFLELREALLKEADGLVLDPELLGTVEEPGNLTRLVTELADVPIANMNTEQLQVVYDALRGIEGAVRSANRMLSSARWAAVGEAADAIRSENGNKGPVLQLAGAAGRVQDLTRLDMLTPEGYFHRLGKSGQAVFKMLRGAQDQFITNMTKATNDTQKIVGDTDVGALEKEKHTVTMGGEKVTMTTAQIMELYCLMQRDQGLQHITTGGIMVEPVRRGIKQTTQAEPLHPSMEELLDAVRLLTPDQIRLADAMQDYLSKDMAELGNEATLAVYGYKKFGQESKYWKIRSNKNEIQQSIEKETQTTSVANRGFTKAVNPNANTSVKIGSIFDTYSQSVNDMATYAAWLAVGEDVNRIRNYVFKDSEGQRTGTVKGILDRVIGSGGANYLQRLLADIANGAGMDDAGLTSGFVGAYKAAAIGANIRVIIQQPTAILRAAEMIDPKYLAAGLKKPMKAFERAKEYSPIAQWKDWGYFDINTGRKMKDVLFESSSKLEKVRQASMALAGKADSFAWGQLWGAVEAETKDRTDLKPGTKEYYQACAERFNDIIDHTQVVDGILQRSQIMRSKNAITRMAVSFMSEPTKQYNQFMSAVYDYRHSGDKKQAKQMLARTMFSMLAAGVMNVLAQSIVDALRNGDRERKYWEKLLQAFLGYNPDDDTFGEKFKTFAFSNMGELINPASYLPYAKDIMSIIQGYSVDRMDMDGISDAITAITRLAKALNGEGKQTVSYSLGKAIEQGAKLLGLSAYNVDRDLTALITTIANDADMPVLQYYLNRYRYRPGENLSKDLKGILWDARQKNDGSYDIIVGHLLKDGYTQEQIDAAVMNRLSDESGFTEARKAADAEGNNNGSYDLSETLEALENTTLSEEDRDVLLEAKLSDKQYGNYTTLLQYSDYDTWLSVMREMPANLSQAKIEAVLDKRDDLTTEQKAAYWQVLSGSKSAKNNPYSQEIGAEILNAKAENEPDKEPEKVAQMRITLSGLGLQDSKVDALAPVLGGDGSNTSKWRAVANQNLGKDQQDAVLKSVMTDAMYRNWTIASGENISLDSYVKGREAYVDLDNSGTDQNSEWTAALEKVSFDKDATRNNYIKGVLWQIYTGSTSTKNNPFDKAGGQAVLDAKGKGGGKGTGSNAPARIPTLRIPEVPKATKPGSGLRIRPVSEAAPRTSSGLRLRK